MPRINDLRLRTENYVNPKTPITVSVCIENSWEHDKAQIVRLSHD